MALNFDFQEMIDRMGREAFDALTDHPTEKGKWHPVTDALIWATMAVDLPGITEKTVDKFVERMRAIQVIDGGYMVSSDGKFRITEEDIRNHLGMRTNVSQTSDKEFSKKIAQLLKEEGERAERQQGKSAVEIVNEKATAS